MKRFLLIIGSLLVLIFVALLVLPRFFKDDIKSAIERELDNSLNAKAYFDENSFSVSVFKNFPNLTVTLNEFGLAGKGVFEGDTLIDVQSMGLEIDLMKLLKGEVTLTGLSLDHPKIFILRLAEGPANYDIVKESEEANTEETAPEEETEGEPMVIAIDHWKITEGTFLYYDTKYNMFMDLEGLNLTGGGDLISSRFDLATELEIARTGFVYDEVTYLSGQSVKGEVVLDMNYSDYTFTFKQNTLYLNDFGLHFDGYFGMPDEGYEMDLTFASEESTFKSLLSLIPAFYSESFADLQADGKVQFDGSVKGLYSFEDDGLPAFRVNMRVDEGNFRYPDLPTAMEAVNLHMIVDNPDGVMDHTRIDLETIDLTLGTTGKVAGSASVRGLTNPDITANLNGSLNLGALAKALPPEVLSGIDLAGDFSFGVNAAGVYNQEQGSIPKFRVKMALKDGRMQYADYPIPMEQIAMQMNASNQSGRLEDTEILLDRLHMRLDGEEMLVKGSLRDLNDYTWKVSAVGGMDLAKIAKVANLEGMTLAGRLEMDLTTEGKYSALQAERYDQLPTSGTLSVANFRYESEDVPMPVAVPVARLEFNPRSAMVKQLDVLLGESDLHLSGTVTNYLSYILEENAVLQGDFNFTSKKLDLNELMGSDEEAVADADTAEEDTTSSSMEVVVVPKNLDLRLNSQLTKVYYDNLEMDNMRGEILVRNGQVELNGLKFGMLDGNFAVSGTYDTRNPDDPQVDLDLDVEEVSLRKAYDASGMVRRIAPVAQNMTGKFSTEFSIHTGLQQDMMPDYSTLTGAGLIAIAKAAMDSGPIVSGLAETTKLGIKDNGVTMRDIVLSAKIENGRFSVRPFDVQVADYKTTVSGSGGLDGSLDYVLQMEIPAGQAGQAVNSLLSSLTGNTANAGSSTINLNVGLQGQYDKPKFSLLGTSAGGSGGSLASQVQTQATQAANNVVQDARQQVTETAQQVVRQGTDSARSVVNQQVDRTRRELQEEADRAAAEAKKKLRNLFGTGRGGGGGGE